MSFINMRHIKLVIILILLAKNSTSQKVLVSQFSAIDKKALQLPDSMSKTTKDISNYISLNFKSDKEKARAIFIWITANIRYDVDNMFAINFYEQKEDKIAKPLKTRKGICENYAALFNDISQKAGIKSFIIEGYTRQNGFTDYIPHAWCAAFFDSSWFMFDPTWGAGYISNGKFYSKINNEYFMSDPSVFIKSHMPFDFLWQFLNYPVSNQEFYEKKTVQNKAKPFFNFKDSIQVYERQTYIEQVTASADRVERNGVKNSLIFDRLQHLNIEIENDKQNKAVNLYNAAVADYNEGINNLNIFIQYRNNQFTPFKQDYEILKMIDTADVKLRQAKTKLNQTSNADANIVLLISQLTKSIQDISTHIKEQQEWLTVYLSKSKSKRKSMFMKKR